MTSDVLTPSTGSSSIASFDTDVLVVGAGPIGLITAAALRHHGVACRLIEQRAETKEYSRANNLWARPQELLTGVGVRDALAEKAYVVTEARTVLNGRPVDPVALDDVESPYPNALYSGQDVMETTLSDLVADRGAAVERGRRMVDLQQDDEGVTVTVADAGDHDGDSDGAAGVERIRCRYVVGADGSSGRVREVLGLPLETESFPGRINRQIDAKLSWRRSTEPDHLTFFYYQPNGFTGVLPIWGGYHRLYFVQDDTGVPDRDPTLEEMQALAREVTQDETLTLTDPIWFSRNRFSHGVTSHYTVGRVLLAGDAGHLTMPIGGQGMNAGIHDAVAVAWRLAMVLAGHAEPVVLSSYDQERRGEHARLDRQQARGFKTTVERGKVADLGLDVASRFVPGIGSLIQGTDDLQQLSVHYPDSALNEDHLGGHLLHRGAPKAGERAPDARVVDQDGATTHLFAHTQNPDGWTWGWSLLAFDGGVEDPEGHRAAAVDAVSRWAWVRPRLVTGASTTPSAGAGVVELDDLDHVAHAAYGLKERPALVLVRPDGHIAYRGPADDPGRLANYCTRVFGPAGGTAG